MPIDPRLLTLVQWLSPAFPTGGFAYSHGLETAIAERTVRDAEGLEAWLADCLLQGSGRADAIWIRCAFAAPEPQPVDADARAFALSHERLRETERQGAAFVDCANAVWALDMPPLLLPVAVGHAAARAELELDATVALYLQAFVTNLVSAAIRLAPIGQTAGQRVIANLQPLCLEVTESTRGAGRDDIFGNAFFSDIAAMRHETLQPRLFQS